MSEENKGVHNVIMEQRRKLNMSGIQDVQSFDDETVVLKTDMGMLTVKGTGLHIGGFSTTSGELTMEGAVYALVYTSDENTRGGFLKRLMK